MKTATATLTRDQAACRARLTEYGLTPAAVAKLVQYGQTLRRMGCAACNGQTPRNHDASTGAVYARAAKLASAAGVLLYWQTDPRGTALYAAPAADMRAQYAESQRHDPAAYPTFGAWLNCLYPGRMTPVF